MNCPFYGYAVIGGSIRPVLFPAHTNECALITAGKSPCRMETAGEPPDWRRCTRNPANLEASFEALRTEALSLARAELSEARRGSPPPPPAGQPTNRG